MSLLDFGSITSTTMPYSSSPMGIGVLAIATVVVARSIKNQWRNIASPTNQRAFAASVLALLLPLLHSLVDFPFHLPALAVMMVVLLAPLLAARD